MACYAKRGFSGSLLVSAQAALEWRADSTIRTCNYMSNAATLSQTSTAQDGDGRSTTFKGLLILCAALLLLAAGASAWFYAGANPAPSEARSLAEGWAVRLAWVPRSGLVVPVLGALSLAGGVFGLVLQQSRAKLLRQLAAERQKSDSHLKRVAGLQVLLAELRQTKEDLVQWRLESEKQYETLAAEKARIEEELNKRTCAEKAMAQKRQELESSKNVLELHVQARKQELQHLQRRYELILNSAGDGILGLDVDGRATFVNPVVAKLTGWPIGDLIGKPVEGLLFPVSSGPKPSAGCHPEEQVFCRQDGSRFPVECVKTPINESDRVVGSVLVFKDITERKRVEETLTQRAAELTRSNAELEQFAFMASHDLQEPLRKIQAFGDRLKLKCDSAQAPETRDYLDRMQNAAARMRTLIDDLLAFSRVMRRSEPFVPVDLGRVTREVLGDLEVRIEKTGAKVEVGELPTIDADATQMRQLILNLLTNALKFQPPGGTPVVKIAARALSAASGEPRCEISVRDNGIGFEEKYLDKIFAVFQRLHGRSEYEGTGVGLAVCRRIVDRHHGNITARSQLGQGATFLVTLPVKQAASTP
jgi:PAS domain S-box-containing protein